MCFFPIVRKKASTIDIGGKTRFVCYQEACICLYVVQVAGNERREAKLMCHLFSSVPGLVRKMVKCVGFLMYAQDFYATLAVEILGEYCRICVKVF